MKWAYSTVDLKYDVAARECVGKLPIGARLVLLADINLL